jgi:hypothetical protein
VPCNLKERDNSGDLDKGGRVVLRRLKEPVL